VSEKDVLKGKLGVLLDNAEKAGCSPEGHSAVASVAREIGGYLTNGFARDLARELRELGAVGGDGSEPVAFHVRSKPVSTATYRKLVASALGIIAAVLPTLQIGGCVIRSRETDDRMAAERQARIAQYQSAQSNMVAAMTAVSARLEKMESSQ